MEVAPYPLHIDALAMMRNMPDELISQIPTLMVNRLGNDPESFMRTENFLDAVKPRVCYRLGMDGFAEAQGQLPATLPNPTTPPSCVLTGDWDDRARKVVEGANILGGNGSYTLATNKNALVVPIAQTTAENLAYYGSALLRVGDVTCFESNGNLPVTITSVGQNYVRNYLLNESRGGGAYLEVHDRPHFHMPLCADAKGYLIIGRRDTDGTRRISAFQIPFGYGIQMAPWAIHSDAHLIGRFMVIYSATESFSTLIVRKKDGALADLSFTTAYDLIDKSD